MPLHLTTKSATLILILTRRITKYVNSKKKFIEKMHGDYRIYVEISCWALFELLLFFQTTLSLFRWLNLGQQFR